MKSLEKVFVCNADKCGDNKFIQLKIEDGIALYERQNMDGRTLGYEVFVVKTILAGAALPGGNFVKETYESYPGSGSFGKTAFFCVHLDRAETVFKQLVKKLKVNTQAKLEDSIANPGKAKKRGRIAKKLNVVLPSVKFTMGALIESTGLTQPTLYVYIQKLIKTGKVMEVGRIKSESGRGKPAVVYSVI